LKLIVSELKEIAKTYFKLRLISHA